jgi:hypothetical protein
MFHCKKYLTSLIFGLALAGGTVAAVVAPQAAVAQADLGAITGVVTDASGAVIANASVTLTNSATGAERVTTTNGKGEYAITEIVAGDYNLKVSASGFADAVEPFTLTVGSSRVIPVKLAVAGSQTIVSISADDTTSVHLENPEVSTVITPDEIQSLPLPDRDPYALVSLSGNVSSMVMGGNRGVGFNIGGARS